MRNGRDVDAPADHAGQGRAGSVDKDSKAVRRNQPLHVARRAQVAALREADLSRRCQECQAYSDAAT